MPAQPVPVTITVKETSDRSSSQLSISVSPDPVHLTGLGPDVDIEWTVASSGWQFTKHGSSEASTGIVVKNPDGHFSDKHGNAEHKKHQWRRNYEPDNKPYRYRISVTDGNSTIMWDPTIMND